MNEEIKKEINKETKNALPEVEQKAEPAAEQKTEEKLFTPWFVVIIIVLATIFVVLIWDLLPNAFKAKIFPGKYRSKVIEQPEDKTKKPEPEIEDAGIGLSEDEKRALAETSRISKEKLQELRERQPSARDIISQDKRKQLNESLREMRERLKEEKRKLDEMKDMGRF